MSAVVERVRKAAEARAAMLRERVRARIAAALPGVTLREEGDRIMVSGRGLVRRWVARDELRDWREIEP
ncbi:MAG TPA: hypothetical protein VF463_06850 [Sphingobium sp.]